MARTYLGMLRDPLRMLLDGVERYGDVVDFTLGPYPYFLISDPDAIRHVLVENAKAYTKSRNYAGLELVLGKGLVTSEGELWKRQRRLIQPVFAPKRIESFVEPMVRCTHDVLDRWERESRGSGGARVDAHHEMTALTFRIVGLTLFGVEIGDETGDLAHAFETAMRYANDYSLSIVRPPQWLPTPRAIAFQRALRTFDAMVNGIVAERRERVRRGGDAGGDLMGALLAAHDDQGGMSDRQLRDEVLTLLGAGHETTANALTFTLYLLSRHPSIERRLHEEVAGVLGDRPLRAEDLPKLELTERVIKESMRLLPPVWAMERQNIEPDVVAGYRAEPGTVIGISPYTLHRDRRWWENPEGFDPDRFLPEREQARPRYVYLPFGAGPRVCIGGGFAMMEAKALLATMVQRCRLELVPGRDLVLDPSITLRPKSGLPMRVVPRKRAAPAA